MPLAPFYRLFFNNLKGTGIWGKINWRIERENYYLFQLVCVWQHKLFYLVGFLALFATLCNGRIAGAILASVGLPTYIHTVSTRCCMVRLGNRQAKPEVLCTWSLCRFPDPQYPVICTPQHFWMSSELGTQGAQSSGSHVPRALALRHLSF